MTGGRVMGLDKSFRFIRLVRVKLVMLVMLVTVCKVTVRTHYHWYSSKKKRKDSYSSLSSPNSLQRAMAAATSNHKTHTGGLHRAYSRYYRVCHPHQQALQYSTQDPKALRSLIVVEVLPFFFVFLAFIAIWW
jgi:hypothetical protein